MELKQIAVNNHGMSQDLSISKESEQNYAFENHNIRIQATDDNTLVSVTNIKGPKQITQTTISGKVLGKCLTPDCLVLFVKDGTDDCIYKIDYDNFQNTLLFRGNLNFNTDTYFDTLYYEEGLKVRKVYWTDGINHPRVINIATENTYGNNSDMFEFYPDIYNNELEQKHNIIPQFNIIKNHETNTQLPAGTIQYFISYYYYNGAETLIANSSDTFTLSYFNRGAKADETGTCALEISIPANTINSKFDYFRIYSAIRTSQEGELIFKIVKDVQIEKNPPQNYDYKILDNGINQETLEASQLYFIGGTPFIAKTLTEKDNTVFFGNLKTELLQVPEEIENIFKPKTSTEEPTDKYIIPNWAEAKNISFVFKNINQSQNQFNAYYNYKLQTDAGSSVYKTFKSGEIYRFGIQFQNDLGQWTDVVWIGDKECNGKPTYDEKTGVLKLNDVEFQMPNGIQDILTSAGYSNYRICIADPEFSNGRKIKAQGVLCPTLFSPAQRIFNAPYALPSWVMRPRQGVAAYHHFEPLFAASQDGAELASFDPKVKYPQIISEGANGDVYLFTFLGVDTGKNMTVKSMVVQCKNPYNILAIANNLYINDYYDKNNYEITTLCDLTIKKSSWAENIQEWYKSASNVIDGNPKLQPYRNTILNSIPSPSTFENIIHSAVKAKTLNALIMAGLMAVSVFLTAVTAGLYTVAALTSVNVIGGLALTGSTLVTASSLESIPIYYKYGNLAKQVDIDEWNQLSDEIKDMVSHNFVPIDIQSKYLFSDFKTVAFTYGDDEYFYSMPTVIKPEKYSNFSISESSAGSMWLQKILLDDCGTAQLLGLYNNYYVDENLVTLHSPEINDNFQKHCDGLNLKIIGHVDMDSNKSIVRAETTPGYFLSNVGGIDNKIVENHSKTSTELKPYSPFYSDYCYIDSAVKKDYLTHDVDRYKIFLFGPEDVVGMNQKLIENYNSSTHQTILEQSALKIKRIFNLGKSNTTNYFSPLIYDDINCSVSFKEQDNLLDNNINVIQLNYDNLIVENNQVRYSTTGENIESPASNRVKFSSTPLALINLKKSLLPIFENYEPFSVGNGKLNVGEGWKTGVFTSKYLSSLMLPPKRDDLTYLIPITINIHNNNVTKYLNTDIWTFGEALQKVQNNKFETVTIKEDGSIQTEVINALLSYISYNPDIKTILSDLNANIVLGIEGCNYYFNKSSLDIPLVNDKYNYTRDTLDESHYGKNALTILDILTNEYGSNTAYHDYEADKNFLCFVTGHYNNLSDAVKNYAANLGYVLSEEYDTLIEDFWNGVVALSLGVKTTDYYNFTQTYNKLFSIYSEFIDTIKTGYATNASGIYERAKYWLALVVLRMAIKPSDEKYRVLCDSPLEKFYTKGKLTNLDFNSEESKIISFDYTPLDYWKKNNVEIGTQTDDDCYYCSEYPFVKTTYRTSQTENTEIIIKKGVIFPEKEYYWNVYNQENINKPKPDKPYLFLGELYYNILYKDLYGGNSDSDLRKLNWLPASKVIPISTDTVANMEGDTYYQRWDCLKTYPTTEEDVNQVVDITSFMVETHINLDERTDTNRAKFNIMSRPTNFNLFNDVYNFKNNLFTYQTKWNNLASQDNPTHITWSLTKNHLADVDSWTNVSLASVTSGKYPVTKLVNLFDSIISVTEHSLDMVYFNAKALGQMSDGSFLELANSNKVDGVKSLLPYGSYNMSTLITENGLYFIEDNENTLIKYNPASKDQSIVKLPGKFMEHWFHNNVIQGTFTNDNNSPFHLEYDNVHKDVYIINNQYCLIYNETLGSFTSFIDFEDTYTLFNSKGKLYSFALNDVWEMYAGDYNWNYTDLIPYSMTYRINPNPYSDKVFTNINLITNKSSKYDLPFDELTVYTDYQSTGAVPLPTNSNFMTNIMTPKFRTWRINIPRDGNKLGGDRIRNPWATIKLENTNPTGEQFVFHNMTVQYME